MNDNRIQQAAQAIREGKLVGMPTETVYGIAADATNPQAVLDTFRVKGRPETHPLIVHVADLAQVEAVAKNISPLARKLMRAFWPGPLTLVLERGPFVSNEVTGGLSTVAVRMPNHPIAHALIMASGRPLSAPSANRFMQLSPTRVEDIDPAVAAKLAFILDGGPCQVGLESTVLDLTGEPTILRPGVLTREELEVAIGVPIGQGHVIDNRSPGMHPRHYAPRAQLVLKSRLDPSEPGLTFGAPQNERQIAMPTDPAAYAVALYAKLHELDRLGVDTIYAEEPPTGPKWDAVRDRLMRASTEIP